MSSIADNMLSDNGVVEWQTAGSTAARRQTPDTFHNQVIESWSEQPWAEFCMELDKPAFLLPVTGFAEL